AVPRASRRPSGEKASDQTGTPCPGNLATWRGSSPGANAQTIAALSQLAVATKRLSDEIARWLIGDFCSVGICRTRPVSISPTTTPLSGKRRRRVCLGDRKLGPAHLVLLPPSSQRAATGSTSHTPKVPSAANSATRRPSCEKAGTPAMFWATWYVSSRFTSTWYCRCLL